MAACVVIFGGGSSFQHFLNLRKRIFDFRHDRNGCMLANYPVKRYKFRPRNEGRFENLAVAEARIATEPEKGSIDPESLRLLLTAFYDNFIYRPLKGLGNFFIVTKSIFYDPKTKIDESYLIS